LKPINKPHKTVSPEITDGDVLRRVIEWGREEKIDFLQRIARRALAGLVSLAGEGTVGEEAARNLHRVLADYLSSFDQLCHAWPQVFKPIARPNVSWPGFVTIDADFKAQNAILIDKLNLGSGAGLNYAKRQWSRKTTAVNVALHLHSIVKSERACWLEIGGPPDSLENLNAQSRLSAEWYNQVASKLKPLNRVNFKQWFEAAWPFFIVRYGEEFQSHRQFAGFWSNADALSTKESKKPRGLMRREIKKAIRQAFEQIAVQPIAEKVESMQGF